VNSASIPIVDVASFCTSASDSERIGAALDRACSEFGFFYVTGHGIDPALSARLMTLVREFFALPVERKMSIAMEHGGRAWRGYFPVDGELTSGRPDRKEGIYFGTELGPDDPRARAGLPLHGMNLYPPVPGFRAALLAYIDKVTALGQTLLSGIAIGLGLGRTISSSITRATRPCCSASSTTRPRRKLPTHSAWASILTTDCSRFCGRTR
jgi:isopenicillin N synthase-like dioxygenase